VLAVMVGVCWCIVKPCNVDAGKGVIRGMGAGEGGEGEEGGEQMSYNRHKIVVPS